MSIAPISREAVRHKTRWRIVIDGIPVDPIFGGTDPAIGGLSADEFISWATKHHGNGWPMLPIGREVEGKPPGKAPWLKYQTGYDGEDADAGEFDTWPGRIAGMIASGIGGMLNLGARLPLGVLGIDVDAYDGKRGLVTLAEREALWGALPDTYRITARRYDGGSGIRLYRVADDYRGPGALKAADGGTGHIELIDRVHRLAAVPPSIHHTGARYRLYGPHGDEITPGVLPPPADLAELPPRWQAGLAALVSEGGTDHQGGWAPDELVTEALAGWTSNDRPKALAPLVNSVCQARSNTYERTRDALRVAAGESRIGLYRLARVVEEMRSAMRESYEKRGEAEKFSEREFSSLVQNAVIIASDKDLDNLRLQANRNKGENTKDYPHMSNVVVAFPKSDTTSENKNRSATVCLADVAPTKVKWLWKGWIPLGKVSILEGESDVGKSTVTLNWASIVSNGRRWPETVIGGKTLVSKHDPADVVLVGIEDSNDDTVVPRLIAAGADLKRIHALNRPTDVDGNPTSFTIPNDIDWLRKAIIDASAKLVIIDPITACLPENTKHGVDSDIRRILMYLVDLARETDSAIVLIRHFNKAAGMSAKNRGGGSVAYSALVRSVLSVASLKEPHDNGANFGIARAIGNLSKQPESIGYKLEDAPSLIGLPQPEDEELSVSLVKWCGSIGIDADQLVGADGAKIGDARKTAPMRDDAEQALKEILADGPIEMQPAIAEAMNLAGCSAATVKNAAKNIGVIKGRIYHGDGPKKGKIKCWAWELPPAVIAMRSATAGLGAR